MKVITQREFQDNSAWVMDAVEAGETFHITRNDAVIAEVRPLPRRRQLTAEELVDRHRALPRVDRALFCVEADALFGSDDRIGEGQYQRGDR
ncbi:type II toxin-antitoxin system Phd/YefM family antitoxin [Actinokineospora bangkokensis]|uniref:PhdYeFM domain-containing protein n=1 Tax=Actinokineospora bangkokensis TaxID=1193682 RepID=A0A1Q9LRE2_9PSEU|nr:PhdYeFM domain-containing protein [Actinokineospora bangkokensis]OLR94599.1 PhdYeFM domain-containing protein [Actinokineospora bangkokensis]